MYPSPNPPGGQLDLVTKPVARGRNRTKRIAESNADHRSHGGSRTGTNDSEGALAQADANGDTAAALQDAIRRAEHERDRAAALLQQAEQDLTAINQRLEDADLARRHLQGRGAITFV